MLRTTIGSVAINVNLLAQRKAAAPPREGPSESFVVRSTGREMCLLQHRSMVRDCGLGCVGSCGAISSSRQLCGKRDVSLRRSIVQFHGGRGRACANPQQDKNLALPDTVKGRPRKALAKCKAKTNHATEAMRTTSRSGPGKYEYNRAPPGTHRKHILAKARQGAMLGIA